ncbi:MAG: hypothetical protein KA251_09685 [Saprospiraceae bacterium]|jgi:hypothetical protein|nr:hypothetical protein [Candidatus Vicinibacter affinis]MBP6174559.1 hypothetical protein [Saprospiraceae bacterium]MBP6523253.1 hypothetical protein [Saprospiraceae bacterium]HQU96441.1 hypothetical protein [Saprospiraceae bacterium]HQX44849.1 hypothetical protein [Saprospiraceae bacterium]
MRNHAKLKTNPAPIIRFYLSKIQSKKIDKCEWELMDKTRMREIFENAIPVIKASNKPEDAELVPIIEEKLKLLI